MSTLTIDTAKPAKGKESEVVDKNLTSPREGEKKATEESLKIINVSSANNNPVATKKPE